MNVFLSFLLTVFCLVKVVMALCSAPMIIFVSSMDTPIMLLSLVMPMSGTGREVGMNKRHPIKLCYIEEIEV